MKIFLPETLHYSRWSCPELIAGRRKEEAMSKDCNSILDLIIES